MLNTIYQRLERIATWPVVSLLFVAFLLLSQGFEWRHKTLGYENRALDGRFWYSPDDAQNFFKSIGDCGRQIYAITELTLDVAFPLVYGVLLASLLIHLYKPKSAEKLVVLPVLAVVADILENITTAYLALQFDGQASSMARIAAIFTALKSTLLIVSLILILVGASAAIWRSGKTG